MIGVPKKIIKLVDKGQIAFSNHFISEQEISIADVENVILNGYFCEKQKDETKQTKYKYIIYGDTMNGLPSAVVGKIVMLEEALFFVITTFLMRK